MDHSQLIAGNLPQIKTRINCYPQRNSTWAIFKKVFHVDKDCLLLSGLFGWLKTQLTITCSKSTIQTPERGVKYV